MRESTILVLNAGSSSLKASVYRLGEVLSSTDPLPAIWSARAQWTELSGDIARDVASDIARDVAVDIRGAVEEKHTWRISSVAELFDKLLESLWSGPNAQLTSANEIDCIGHRIVHGGARFQQSVRITPEVLAAIKEATVWAPQHNRLGLEGVAAVERAFGPDAMQIGVFDTAFHHSLPEESYVYPGPYEWLEKGIRRYGFHGISHQYATTRAAHLLGRDLRSLRVISCHLGNGCSLAALKDGVCVDTTMGFTPLEGLMMGSRSGTVDPGILIHLLRQGMSVDDVDAMLHHRSGLAGISGVSSDLREVTAAAENGNMRAQLALKIYAHRLRFHLGGLIAGLGGVDLVVFTGGVGENSPALRSAVCGGMTYCGLTLNEQQNASLQGDGEVSAADSKVRVMVVKSREEWQIALECQGARTRFAHEDNRDELVQ
ncbi:MAG: acetate/propionate family kinase [Bryobacteraceae bacterium]